MESNFCVIKRNGSYEEVSFDKVTRRIKQLCYGLSDKINPIMIAQKVCAQIYNNVSTAELDELAAQICISLETTHLDYGVLASRIIISNNHKTTSPSFSETIYILYQNGGKKTHLISDDVYEIVMKNKEKLNAILDYENDKLFDYFGFKTLEKSYLMKVGNKTVERIQHMFMRVSLGIHKDDLRSAINSYELMSKKYFIHATPTLYFSGTPRQYFASCFLLGMDDSVKGIYKCVSDCAEISAGAGGIGLSLSSIRSKNSYIHGLNGVSNGIIPLCRVLNETARHINQAGKRPGSIAVYLEPHHPEILEFLELRKNTGAESERARDLFLALWISDLFMRRIEADQEWSLFDPNECPGLDSCYGEEYDALYHKYESEGRARKRIPARKIWNYALTSQIETGTPYISFKDSVNKKSNQKNIGVIRNSNLCVVGETQILTKNGFEIIRNLVDKEVEVWNGLEFSKTTVMKTGENQKIIKVVMNDGTSLECTPYHKFYIKNDEFYEDNNDKIDYNLDSPNILVIEANNLKPNMRLAICIDGAKHIVSEIIDENKIADTFCFNEPIRHAGIFNGIFCGNCNEITEYSAPNEYAVCTLASLSLPTFIIDGETPSFDYDKLIDVISTVVRNLNKIIDINYYPVPETELSNKKHRPIGIGVQGLADVFARFKIPFDSVEARELNKNIFETMYYGAMRASCNLAIENGKPYSTYEGSPISQGIFQFEMWGKNATTRHPWEELRSDIANHGVYNSLMIALMPTASTSQILGNNECFEPFTSNIYTRRTLAGDFVVVNKHLVRDLIEQNLWSASLKDEIIKQGGSVQHISGIPNTIKNLYKTVWEIKQKVLIDLAIDRSPYVCQTQSMNLFFEEPSHTVLTSALFYGWKNGLKTGSYYIRSRPKAQAQQFTIEPTKKEKNKQTRGEEDNEGTCEMCSA